MKQLFLPGWQVREVVMKMLNNSTQFQRARLLAWLREKSISTIECRHQLDILGVAPRIFELRHHYGFNIVKNMVEAENPGGGKHKIAQYTLLSGKYKGKLNAN